MNKVITVVFQIVVALIIFVILNNISIALMNKEDIIDDPTKRVKTVIFDGWVETQSFTDKQYDTHNVFASNYKKLPNSVNKMGGAQFSYSVWVKLNNTSAENVSEKILFLQGDKSQYPYTETVGNQTSTKNGYLVKCPLVKFGDSADTLVVEVNTTMNITDSAEITRVQDRDETIRHNLFSLLPGQWVLFTFVFEDNKPYGMHEDAVVFKFFVNDILYHTQKFKGALRLNKGDLCILPNGGIQDGYLSDLTYYNYALNVKEIQEIISKGRTNKRYTDLKNDPTFNKPLYLSQYNRLDITNM
jgi:hypothetical protein